GCSGGGQAPAAGPVVKITATASSVPSATAGQKASARAAAKRFYGLYATSDYATLWTMLAPVTRHQVPRKAWIGVHQACSAASAGKSRVIKGVTVFGNAAIVAEAASGVTLRTAEDVFNYSGGRWRYSPQAPGIYRHRSVTADIAAAKAAGLCKSSKVF
ncbi:MAG TPA: hypothetical protein VFQ68_27020, partial [Streptosporangiaceae bacterium]|nr:hypothetical protein [Streptosporangiaceae bacterium]